MVAEDAPVAFQPISDGILREHQELVDRHGIELRIIRRTPDSSRPSRTVYRGTDVSRAIEIAQDSGGEVFVLANDGGPYWRWQQPDCVLPWALQAVCPGGVNFDNRRC